MYTSEKHLQFTHTCNKVMQKLSYNISNISQTGPWNIIIFYYIDTFKFNMIKISLNKHDRPYIQFSSEF